MNNIWREAAAGNVDQVINLSRTVGVNIADQWGWTPLHWACKKNHPLLVAELLRSRANPLILDLVCFMILTPLILSPRSLAGKYSSADSND